MAGGIEWQKQEIVDSISPEQPDYRWLSGAIMVRNAGDSRRDWIGFSFVIVVTYFALQAVVMVNRARAKNMAKRGSRANHVNFDDAPEIASGSRDREMVAIDDALNELAQIDLRKARVIELRFFGGLSVEETAEVLKISTPIRDARLEDGQGLASRRTCSLNQASAAG